MARKSVSTSGSSPSSWYGPFVDSNDNVYVVVIDSASAPEVRKAGTDPLVDAWIAQDTINKPLAVASSAMGVWFEGAVLHIVTWNSGGNYYYHTFGTSDNASADQWLTTDGLIEAPANAPIVPACHISVRSDGDVVVLYNGDTDRIMGTNYDRCDYRYEEGSGWSATGTVFGGSGEQDFHSRGIGRGASDETWFLCEAVTDGDIRIRSLSSTNTISPGAITHDEPGFNSTSPHVGYYDDAGVEVMTNAWNITTQGYSIQTRGGTLQSELSLSGTDMESSSSLCVATDGTDAYVVYRSGTDDDVKYQVSADGAAWGDITTVSTATAPAEISANVIDHGGGKVLAVVYDDGDVYYDEVSIGAAAASDSPNRQNARFNHLLRR